MDFESSEFSGQAKTKGSVMVKSKMIHSNLDAPTCVLVKLSQNETPAPKIRHQLLPKYNRVPDDVLTNLHSNTVTKGQKQR